MKNTTLASIALSALLPMSAFALPTVPSISPVLVNLGVSDVGTTGKVLETTTKNNVTTLLVTVPVKVTFPDACTDFAGQETFAARHDLHHKPIVAPTTTVAVKGSQEAKTHSCVALAVAATAVDLTVSVSYNALTPIASASKLVRFANAGTYNVSVDLHSQKVNIDKVMP